MSIANPRSSESEPRAHHSPGLFRRGFRATRRVATYAALVLVASSASAFNCPDDLVNGYDAPGSPSGYDYEVYYKDAFLDPDYFSLDGAKWVADAMVSAHLGYTAPPHNFRAPYFDAFPQKTCIYDSDDTGTAPEDHITLDAPGVLSFPEQRLRQIITHEQFHHIQYRYIDFGDWPALGDWVVEGTARAMEDTIYDDVDQFPAFGSFVPDVNSYLGNPNSILFQQGYKAALFWSYLMDQLGQPFAEPARGVDFMRRLWEIIELHELEEDGVQALRTTIEEFDPEVSLEDLFLDFAITNYTHDLDVSALPRRFHYRYFDETPQGGGTPYRAVKREAPPQIQTAQTSSVLPWGSRYIEWDLEGASSCSVYGVWAGQSQGRELGWAVIGVRNGGRVTELLRARGSEIYRGFLNSPLDPFDKIVLVSTGIGQDSTSDFNYAFDLAFSAAVDLLAPLDYRPQYVGDANDPGRFLVKIYVDGPGLLRPFGLDNPSIKGLDPDTFEVVLRSAGTGKGYPAQILNSDYVDGEYWLTVAAPVVDEVADGITYDVELTISGNPFCPPAVASEDSVIYAEEVLHQAHVVDRSGSMSQPQPEEESKIIAAKNAVRLSIDAGDDEDSMGIASFAGDDVECNFDAVTEHPMVELPFFRDDLKQAMNGIEANGYTSIGDGIREGLALLAAAVGPVDRRSIALYSDGLENEGDFWRAPNGLCTNAAVRDPFNPGESADDVQIDAIAFGADADQNLLQSISTHTGGDFYPVSTDEELVMGKAAPTAHKAAAAAATEDAGLDHRTLHVANRLADVYSTIQAQSAESDRMFSRADSLLAGQPVLFRIAVTEAAGGGVTQGVFAFNWHLDNASVSVTLRDTDGAAIAEGSPAGWQLRRDATHSVFKYQGVLSPGSYEIALQSDIDVQVTSTLTGQVRRGVDLDLRLGPVRSATPHAVCTSALAQYDPKFWRGLPVKVSASLTDISGGIGSLDAVARVINADGSVNRVVLHDDGSHGDDTPGDGVYTNHYTRTPFATFGGVVDLPPAPPSGSWGSYLVTVAASGTSNFGESFSRTQLGGFAVFQEKSPCFPDDDGDGLPTRWEQYYGLDPFDPTDAGKDQDIDGLSATEEFFHGTHPLDPDTDGGGEADGSEVLGGRDPLFERDDLLPRMFDFGVVRHLIDLPVHRPVPETNIIHFPVNPAYRRMELWRKSALEPDFSLLLDRDLVAEPSGVYYDENLVNGLEYEYYLIAFGESGARTPQTSVFTGTPLADPLAPEGWVTLDGSATAADSLDVVAGLDESSQAHEVRLSEDPLFTAAPWQPMTHSVPLLLEDQGPGPWTATVYVQYRDLTGNESPIEHDSIVVDTNGDADGDSLINAIDKDDDGDGLQDLHEITLFAYDPFRPDTDGDGILDSDEDFDGDGYSDSDEIALGTNPLDPRDPKSP